MTKCINLIVTTFLLILIVKTASAVEPVRIFILAGQSNMDGRGDRNLLPDHLLANQDDVMFYFTDHWTVLQQGSSTIAGNPYLFGPEITFGRTIKDALPTEKIAIIKHAEGGTNLYEDWDPETGYLYPQLMDKINAATETLTLEGTPWTLEAAVWMQGESDANQTLSIAQNYGNNLRNFIARLRADTLMPELPFVIGQIHAPLHEFGAQVKAHQAAVNADTTNTTLVVTDDLNLQSDDVHYDAAGFIELGRRFSTAARAYLPGVGIHVDDNASGAGDGSYDNPYPTIQAALDVSSINSLIIVQQGIYKENIVFPGHDVILRSNRPEDPKSVIQTVIDAGNSGSAVTFNGDESATCVLLGFSIMFGDAINGGGISGNGTLATIENNRFIKNIASNFGGALHNCDGLISRNFIVQNEAVNGGGISSCDGTIENNIIADNIAVEGGGLYACNGSIINNTIYGNAAGIGGGLRNCVTTITNNIVWNNSATSSSDQLDAASTPTFCNIQSWPAETLGNFASDPLLQNPAAHNFLLSAISPCIAAGTVTTTLIDFEGQSRTGSIDVGADEVIAGLQTHLDFHEGSGSSASDLVGSNNGSFQNGTQWGSGITNSGGSFDGNNDYVLVGTNGLAVQSGTISLWSNSSGFSGTQIMFGHTTVPTYANRLRFYTASSTNNLRMALGDNGALRLKIAPLEGNAWHHLVLSWNDGDYVVYVDGLALAGGEYSGFTALNPTLDLGNTGSLSSHSSAHAGLLDEYRTYNRALDHDEVQKLYRETLSIGTQSPRLVENLSAIPISPVQINLAWDAGVDDGSISSYNIYRNDVLLGSSLTTSYVDFGLTTETLYAYQIAAVDITGQESNRSCSSTTQTEASDLPGVTIDDITLIDSSTTQAIFTLNLTAVATQTVTIDFATQDGSATAGIDYIAASGTAIFTTGTKTTQVIITIPANSDQELNENFFVNLSLPVNCYQLDFFGEAMLKDNDTIISDGLVGYWPFDEGAGNTAVDISDHSNDGLLGSASTWESSGRLGNAIMFNQTTNDYVEIGTNDWNKYSGTLMFWCKTSSFPNEKRLIFGHTSIPTFNNRIQFYTSDPSGTLKLGLANKSTEEANIANLDENVWYHLVLTWTTSGYEVYVDGSSKANGFFNGLNAFGPIAHVGNSGSAALTTLPYNGLVDDVRVYDRVLSSSEIEELFYALPDTEPPTIPRNLVGNSPNFDQVDLTWSPSNDVKSTVASYRIFRDGIEIGVTTGTAITDTGLLEQTAYSYTITATDSLGFESALSAPLVVNTIEDPIVFISINDVIFTEGDSGTDELHFQLTLSKGVSFPVAVRAKTFAGSALVDEDFEAEDVIMTFAPYQTIRNYSVSIVGNVFQEPPKNFTVELSQAQNVIITDGLGEAILKDNDVFLPDGLVGYWPMNESTGTVTFDYSNSGNNGLLSSGLNWTSGLDESAIEFHGTVNDLISIGTQDWTTNQGSFSVWMSADNFKSTTGTIFGHQSPTGQNLLQLYAEGVTGKLNLGLGDDFEQETEFADMIPSFWHHVVVTWQNGNYFVYVDGINTVSGSSSGLSDFGSIAHLGNSGDPGNLNQAFDGLMDEIRVYNRPLSASEVILLRDSVADVTPPAVPENLTLDSVSFNSVSLSWDPSIDNVGTAGYNVFQDGDLVSTTSLTQFTVTNLTPETTYSFRVRAYDFQQNASELSLATLALTLVEPPLASIEDTTFAECLFPEKMHFKVRLSKATAIPVSMEFETVANSAFAGSDFVPVAGTVNFAAGELEQTIEVEIIRDFIVEPQEKLYVRIFNPVDILIDRDQAAGIIDDSDGPGACAVQNWELYNFE